MVRDGRIDTLVVAITDMQGRLMGKRVQAQAFLSGVIDHGAHFCTYLLGTDMEMNTPEGFRLMNWETGYGDWIAAPVWDTLRVLPWLEKTALVLSDTVDEETHTEIPVSPRTILKRQVAAAAELGFTVKAGSEFEYYVLKDSWEDLHRKGWTVPETFGYYNEDYHLLQATKAEPLHRLLRNQMTEARIPIEFSKGEAAPGQHEVNIRYDEVLESADRSVIFKHGAKEIAYLNGWGITFMSKPDHRWTGLVGPPPHERLGPGRRALADARPGVRPALRHERDDEPVPGRDDEARPGARPVHRPERQLATSAIASLSWAPVNVVWGRDNRTTGFRVVGSGPALHVECRFPGGDMNAYLTYAAMIGAGCTASATASRRRPSTRATATSPPGSSGCRAPSTRRSAASSRARPRSRSSARTWSPTTSTPPGWSRTPTTRSSTHGTASDTSSARDPEDVRSLHGHDARPLPSQTSGGADPHDPHEDPVRPPMRPDFAPPPRRSTRELDD